MSTQKINLLAEQVRSISIVLNNLICEVELLKRDDHQPMELTEAELSISHNYDNASWEER